MFDFLMSLFTYILKMEQRMSDLNAKVDDIKAKLAIEAEQGAALAAKLAELKARFDAIQSETYPKEAVYAALDEIAAIVPGVNPDLPEEPGTTE